MNKKILKFLSLFFILLISSFSIVFAISLIPKKEDNNDDNISKNPLGRDDNYQQFNLTNYLNDSDGIIELKQLFKNTILDNHYSFEIDQKNFEKNIINLIKKCLDQTKEFYQKSDKFSYEISYFFTSKNQVKIDAVWTEKSNKNHHFFDQFIIEI